MCIYPHFTAFHQERWHVFMGYMDRIALGIKIKAARKAKGLSQKELERLSGVSERTIQEMEAGDGNPGLSNLESIEQTLKTDIIGLAVNAIIRPSAKDLKILIEEPEEVSQRTVALVLQELLAVAPEVRASALAILYGDQSIVQPYREKAQAKPKAR